MNKQQEILIKAVYDTKFNELGLILRKTNETDEEYRARIIKKYRIEEVNE